MLERLKSYSIDSLLLPPSGLTSDHSIRSATRNVCPKRVRNVSHGVAFLQLQRAGALGADLRAVESKTLAGVVTVAVGRGGWKQ